VYTNYEVEGVKGFYDNESGYFLKSDEWKPLTFDGTSGLYHDSGYFIPGYNPPKTGVLGAVDDFKRLGLQAATFLNKGMKGVAKGVGNVADVVTDANRALFGDEAAEQDPISPAIKSFTRDAQADFSRGEQYWQEKQNALGPHRNAVSKYGGAMLGGALPGAVEFMAGVPYAAVQGYGEAKEQGRNPLVGAVTGGLERKLMGETFGALHPLKSVPKAIGGGGVMAAHTAAQGGSPEEIAAAGATGLILNAGGKGSLTTRQAIKDFKETTFPASPYGEMDPRLAVSKVRNRYGYSDAEIQEANREEAIAKAERTIENAPQKTEYKLVPARPVIIGAQAVDELYSGKSAFKPQYPGEATAQEPGLLITSPERQTPYTKTPSKPRGQFFRDWAHEGQRSVIKGQGFDMSGRDTVITQGLFGGTRQTAAQGTPERQLYDKMLWDKQQVKSSITDAAPLPPAPSKNRALRTQRQIIEKLIPDINKQNPTGNPATNPLAQGPLPMQGPIGPPKEVKGWIDLEGPKDAPEPTVSAMGARKSGFLHGVADTIQRFFKPGSTLPSYGKWMETRQEDARGSTAKGVEISNRLLSRFRNESKDDLQAVWDLIHQKVEYNALTQHQKYLSNRVRTIDDIVGRNLVKEGIISYDTYLKNQGKHLRHMYEIYDYEIGARGGKIPIKSFKERVLDYNDPRDLLEMKARGIVEDPLKSLSMGILEGTKAKGMAAYFSKIAQMPDIVYANSMVKIGGRRMGIDAAKDELGMYYARKNKTPEMIARQQELEAVIHASEAKEMKPSKDFIKLQGKQYGDMNGAYIHKDVYSDIVPVIGFRGGESSPGLAKLREGAILATALWKTKSVALNLPTVARNLLFSNAIQMNMSGTPLPLVEYYFARAIKAYAKKEWSYRALLKQGVFQTNYSAQEIGDLLEMVKQTHKNDSPLVRFIDLTNKLGSFYGKGDDIWKLAKFIEQKERFKVSDQKAAFESQKWIMDYSLLHPSIRAARTYPLGAPFITYQYKILPLIAESLAKNPLTIGKWAMLPVLLQTLGVQDLTPEEAEEYTKSLPQHVKDGQTVTFPYVSEKNGQRTVHAIDLSYMFPWGNIWQWGAHLKRGDVGKAVVSTGFGSGPEPSLLFALVSNQDMWTRKPIVDAFEAQDPKLKLTALLRYLTRMTLPSMMTMNGAFDKIWTHETIGKTDRGIETEWFNAYPRLGGVNIYPIDPRAARLEKAAEMSDIGKAYRARAIKERLQGDTEGLNEDRERLRIIMERKKQEMVEGQ